MLISLIIEQVNLLHRSFNQFKMEVKRRYNNVSCSFLFLSATGDKRLINILWALTPCHFVE